MFPGGVSSFGFGVHPYVAVGNVFLDPIQSQGTIMLGLVCVLIQRWLTPPIAAGCLRGAWCCGAP